MLFARVPRPGHVKTRLSAGLGEQGACALYGAFLEDAARIYRGDGAAGWAPVLLADPDPEDPAIGSIFDRGWRPRRQAAGGLGERLAEAFAHERALGAPAAAAVGSDHPALPLASLRQLFASLALEGAGRADAVVVPAEDGGYCAIGLAASAPLDVFEGIPWSTPRVLEETVARFERLGLRWRALAPAYDVDVPEDVERLRRDLAVRDPREDDFPSATARVLAATAAA
jgi:rSAM/selenodomain-associated transferase 1